MICLLRVSDWPWIFAKETNFWWGQYIKFLFTLAIDTTSSSWSSYTCLFFREVFAQCEKTRFLFDRIYTQTPTSKCWMIRKKANKKTTAMRWLIFQQALHYFLASRDKRSGAIFVNSPILLYLSRRLWQCEFQINQSHGCVSFGLYGNSFFFSLRNKATRIQFRLLCINSNLL